MNPSRRNQKQTVIDIFNRRADQRIEKKQTQKQLLALIQQKNTQLSVLNHVNSRLGAELVILQKKLGIDHDKVLQQLQQIKQISAAFHFQTQQLEYLDALLTSYDENNLLQKKIIANLYTSLQDAELKTQNLVKDNQFLLNQLQNKSQQILQIYSKGFADENLSTAYAKIQRQTQIQIIENTKQQNQYLIQNYRNLQDKNEKNQALIKQLKKSSDHYSQLYKKQSEDLKLALIKIDDLLKIKDVLQRKFDQITKQNIQIQTKKQQLQTKTTRLQNQVKQLRNQLHLLKTLKHEQIERVGQDFSTLKMQHEASQKRERQYFNKNMILQRDMQNQKQDLKLLKRELQKTKSDFEQTLKMCQTYEHKIGMYSKKQIIIKQTMQDCKQKLESAILQRDKAILKQKQLQKVIQSLKERNKNQLQNIKGTFEKLIYQQNEKIKILEQDKDDRNSVFYQNQCSYKYEIQKLKRDNQMLKQQNYRHADNIKNSSGNQIISRMKQLQQKNESFSRILNQKERIYLQDCEHKNQIIKNLQMQNRELGRQTDRERAAARDATNEKTQLKSKISILQKEKQCLEDQINKLKKNIEAKASAQNQQKSLKIRQLQQKLAQAIKNEKLLKQNTIILLQKHDQAQQKYQLQCQNKIITLQNQIKKLKRRAERDTK